MFFFSKVVSRLEWDGTESRACLLGHDLEQTLQLKKIVGKGFCPGNSEMCNYLTPFMWV
jgi:hypothetical protein